MGSIPLFAYTYGAGNRERLRAALKVAVLLSVGTSAVFSIPVWAFRDWALYLAGGPSIITAGDQVLTALLFSTVFYALVMLLVAWFQACGKGVAAVVLTASVGVFFFVTVFAGDTLLDLPASPGLSLSRRWGRARSGWLCFGRAGARASGSVKKRKHRISRRATSLTQGLLPPRIGDTHRNRAFMPTAQIDALQLFGDGGVNFFTLQVVVDLRVGDAEFVLIGAPGDTVEQVGCRRLSPQPFGCAQNPQKQLILPLIQSRERQYIRPSVAELREETGHGFRRVVGSDDQQGRVASERILGDHAGTRLNISLVEVADGRAHGSRVGGVEAIDRIRNIEGDGTVGEMNSRAFCASSSSTWVL